LLPALGLVVGAVVAASSDVSFRSVLPALPAVWGAAAFCWWRRLAVSATTLIVIGFGLSGLLSAGHARERALHPPLRAVLDARFGGFSIDTLGPEADHEPVLIRARLLEDAAVRDDYVSLRARVVVVDGAPATGGVSFTVSGESALGRAGEWRAGRVIEAPATFRRPARYLNEGVPDAERRLALDGTTLFGSIKSGLLVDVVARGTAFQEWAADMRARVRGAVHRWVAPHSAIGAAIVTAVLIGDRTGLPDEATDRLQRAGTYHVIAISGGNVAILAGLVLGLLTCAGVRGRARAVSAAAALLVYAGIATAGPSVWRATTMAVVYLAARALDHRTPPWQAIAVAAGLMAVASPLDVVNPGFVLTFGATCALVESVRWFDRRTAGRTKSGSGRVGAWVRGSVAASVAVELVLMPVSAASFSRVTLAGPLLNLAAVPLMAVAQVAGLLVVAADAWPVLAGPVGWLAAGFASAIVSTATLVDAVPALSWRVPPPAASLLVLYYVVLLATLFAPKPKLRLVTLPLLIVILLIVVGVTRLPDTPAVPGMRLTLLDVGQGEAMLLESADRRLQIDAGGAPFGSGAFDVGARVVAPSLWAREVTRLDAVLITHGDPDHMGGARVLLEDFPPRQLWEGVVVPRHEPSGLLRQLAQTEGIKPVFRRAGEAFRWGHARVRVLHPLEPDWERPRVRNDDSVVLEVSCGDIAMLLTGDISADVEREVAGQLTPARVRVLKVAHHGSRTSSSPALLERWRPQIALISAGRGNTFGHPTPEVIERLEAVGARIYRTDRDGQITLETDSECGAVDVRTFNDKRRR
jgi:competence protein ComEC